MNHRGFTLLEMLVVLSIVLLVVSFLPFLLDVRWLHEKQLNQFHPLEWQVFLEQMKSEIRESKQLQTTETILYAYKPTGEKVSFEKYGSLIRRRVNGQGNEVVLQSISDVRYELAQNGVWIEVITTKGKRYEAFVSTFFPVQVKP
ncbi:competence type IV pilus minor pilin ComGF [Anoxybacillus sp. J5B_2022]|uniref:competence type IV pilus minor pilin ComGF n=1 Tax=Anoxybacillus sp. J5B_2022 TaxID=3003246 RepID=UPI002285B69C|nr:competence type IV pilus minor pilin ComGF [Anoxybacillus sp. J5B_2022]MCZ0754641.1 competence type IV pilus minor pilin ComGF [Anoxybacillus sp. J5B_2022]